MIKTAMAFMIMAFSLLPFHGSSQSIIESGSVWHYIWGHYSGSNGFIRMNYAKDTVILQKNWKVLELKSFNWVSTPPPAYHAFSDSVPMTSRYVRESGDTLFQLDGNEERILFNFAASVGDNWVTSIDSFPSDCGDTSGLQVDSIGTHLIGNRNREFIRVFATDSSKLRLYSRVFKGIGPKGDFFFPTDYGSCDSNIISHPVSYNFNCFQSDSTTLVQNLNFPCEYLLSNDEVKSLESRIQIYPNPTSDYLTIEGYHEKKTLRLFDSFGRELRFDIFGTRLDVRGLMPGLYLLQVEVDGKFQVHKFLRSAP